VETTEAVSALQESFFLAGGVLAEQLYAIKGDSGIFLVVPQLTCRLKIEEIGVVLSNNTAGARY
jgi:hypothetical protein